MFSIVNKHRVFYVVGIFCCISIFVTSVFADVVVLRTGSELHGTIANKEQVAAAPNMFSKISILVEGQNQKSSLQSIDVADIHYIILEDGAEKRVIEFSQHQTKETVPETPFTRAARTRSNDNLEDGLLLSTAGVAVGLVGAFVKFGEEKLTVTESSVDYDEKTYNAANYCMMVGGGAMFIGGIFLASSDGSSTSGVHLYIDENSGSVGFGYAFRY